MAGRKLLEVSLEVNGAIAMVVVDESAMAPMRYIFISISK